MTYSDEHVARLEAQADAAATERRQLRAIIAELRGVLGTPDNASVVQHARDVMAEAQACREDLAQALHDAAKWRAVPWLEIDEAIHAWQSYGLAADDAMYGITHWRSTVKLAAQEVTE